MKKPRSTNLHFLQSVGIADQLRSKKAGDFYKYPNAIRDSGLKWKERMVLNHIVKKYVRKDWEGIFPCQQTLADELGFCLRTVNQVLKSLQTKGYLKSQSRVIKGQITSKSYSLGMKILEHHNYSAKQKANPSIIEFLKEPKRFTDFERSVMIKEIITGYNFEIHPNALDRVDTLKPFEKLLLFEVYTSFRKNQRYSGMKYETYAKCLHVSTASIERSFRVLKDENLLFCEKGQRQNMLYLTDEILAHQSSQAKEKYQKWKSCSVKFAQGAPSNLHNSPPSAPSNLRSSKDIVLSSEDFKLIEDLETGFPDFQNQKWERDRERDRGGNRDPGRVKKGSGSDFSNFSNLNSKNAEGILGLENGNIAMTRSPILATNKPDISENGKRCMDSTYKPTTGRLNDSEAHLEPELEEFEFSKKKQVGDRPKKKHKTMQQRSVEKYREEKSLEDTVVKTFVEFAYWRIGEEVKLQGGYRKQTLDMVKQCGGVEEAKTLLDFAFNHWPELRKEDKELGDEPNMLDSIAAWRIRKWISKMETENSRIKVVLKQRPIATVALMKKGNQPQR